ncbi:MAG: AmmeMemoRadiSam system radical SAM enzyme [Acidobacteria bacterium]|nr:AmmeMemoRadiSam system radical SAM enzyme [Acidobacteriota bacterium]
MQEALLYQRIEDDAVRCGLCAHRCRVSPGRRGVCGVRENRGGTLFSLVADRIVAEHVDPVEKKPLYHYQPASRSYSVAAEGCNFRCRFCQNSAISQLPLRGGPPAGRAVTPDELVQAALDSRCRSLSFTYTEPTVYFELARSTGIRARERGLGNVFVTNGYMTAEAAEACSAFLDAANVDLKSFSEDFYREVCGGSLQPVLDTIRRLSGAGVHVEVTTLLVPGLNDSPGEIAQIARFLAGVHPEIPWHVSAFHPDYRMTDRPPTPPEKLLEAHRIGTGIGLKHVYCGNVPGLGREDTACPACGALLIERRGFRVVRNRLDRPACPDCGAAVRIIL